MHQNESHTLVFNADVIDPKDWLRFIHLKPFDRKWHDLGLDDEDLAALQILIMAGPDIHPVVKGTGGLRKIRFAGNDPQRGKRGAYRICYAYLESYETILLVTVFAKNEQDSLTEAGKKAIRGVIEEIQDLLDQGNL